MSDKKSKLLILYSTVDGHAKHICEYAQEKLNEDKAITIASLDTDSEQDLSDFDEVLLGASVRYGYHRKNVYEFVTKNKDTLSEKKTAFFSLNLTARKPEKATPETNPYIVKFLKKVPWLKCFETRFEESGFKTWFQNVVSKLCFDLKE